jgi:hypothetical protein
MSMLGSRCNYFLLKVKRGLVLSLQHSKDPNVTERGETRWKYKVYTGSKPEESHPPRGVHVKAEACLPPGHITAPGAWPQGNPKRNAAGAYLKRKKDRCAKSQKNLDHFSICACHPCAGAMLIFSVSFQFYRMSPKRHSVLHALVYELVRLSLVARGGTNRYLSFPDSPRTARGL